MSKEAEPDHGANPGAAGFALLATLLAIAMFWAGHHQGKNSKGFTRDDFKEISGVLFEARALSTPSDHGDIETATMLVRNLCELRHSFEKKEWKKTVTLARKIRFLVVNLGAKGWTNAMREESWQIQQLVDGAKEVDDNKAALGALRHLIQTLRRH